MLAAGSPGTLAHMPVEQDDLSFATVTGSCRLAVAVQGLDGLDGLDVDYEGCRLADGSIAAWAAHEDMVLAVTVMPDGGGVLLGTYPDARAARAAVRRAQAWRGWPD
jgi:hypothetical protein